MILGSRLVVDGVFARIGERRNVGSILPVLRGAEGKDHRGAVLGVCFGGDGSNLRQTVIGQSAVLFHFVHDDCGRIKSEGVHFVVDGALFFAVNVLEFHVMLGSVRRVRIAKLVAAGNETKVKGLAGRAALNKLARSVREGQEGVGGDAHLVTRGGIVDDEGDVGIKFLGNVDEILRERAIHPLLVLLVAIAVEEGPGRRHRNGGQLE